MIYRFFFALALLVGCDDTSNDESTPTPDVTLAVDAAVDLGTKPVDAAPLDVVDAELPDAALSDAAPPDAGRPDAAPPDASAPDAAASEIPLGPDGRPEGWTEVSHGKDATPNYAKVFPQDRVNQLHLRCSEETWSAMLDDLSALTGSPADDVPDRPSLEGGGELPEAWIAACEGHAVNEPCEIPEGDGICFDDPELGLVCFPDEGIGLPPEAFEACEGLTEEAECVAGFMGGEEGLCLQDFEGLACIPLSWLEGGPGPGGDDLYAAAAFWERKPSWFSCDVVFEEQVWHRVGVRFKGNSTLAFSAGQTFKLPLRFDFDEHEDAHPAIDDQRFFGFKHLSTTNQIADSSFLHQKLTSDLLRAAGAAAPQTAFYRIFLDHGDGSPIYMGLYTASEVPRAPLLAAQFGDASGTLYECDGRGAMFGEFHPESFHRKTNKSEEDYSDVEAFIAALNATPADAAEWRAGLEATFDMEGFLRFLALNQAAVNWDTYGELAHNYYVYGDPTQGGRLSWIAWDFDLSLEGDNDLSLMSTGPEWPLLHRVARDPVYAARYRALLGALIEGPFKPAAVTAEARRLRALIEPYVTGDEGEEPRYTSLMSEEDFGFAFDRLIEHVEARAEATRAFIEAP